MEPKFRLSYFPLSGVLWHFIDPSSKVCVGLPMLAWSDTEVTICLLLRLMPGRRTTHIRWTHGAARAAGQTGVAAPLGALQGQCISLCTERSRARWHAGGEEKQTAPVPLLRWEEGIYFLEQLVGPSGWCQHVLPWLLSWCKSNTQFLWASHGKWVQKEKDMGWIKPNAFKKCSECLENCTSPSTQSQDFLNCLLRHEPWGPLEMPLQEHRNRPVCNHTRL